MRPGGMPDYGAIAQLGERLICIQEVVGSTPSGSTIAFMALQRSKEERPFPEQAPGYLSS